MIKHLANLTILAVAVFILGVMAKGSVFLFDLGWDLF